LRGIQIQIFVYWAIMSNIMKAYRDLRSLHSIEVCC
jgi:hypothetical protein